MIPILNLGNPEQDQFRKVYCPRRVDVRICQILIRVEEHIIIIMPTLHKVPTIDRYQRAGDDGIVIN